MTESTKRELNRIGSLRYGWWRVSKGIVESVSEFASQEIPSWTMEQVTSTFQAGGVVVIPTDTVYGLSSSLDPKGIDEIFAAKRRPRDVALPVLLNHLEAALDLVAPDAGRERARLQVLGRTFWPGALTVVVRRDPRLRVELGGNDQCSIGLRVPKSVVVRSLIDHVGPIVVTSANLHRQTPITDAAEFLEPRNENLVARLAGILSDREGSSALPSTVVDLRERDLKFLRIGIISPTEIQDAIDQSSYSER